MMAKASIPLVATGKPDLDMFLAAVKQNLDQTTGRAKGAVALTPLNPSTAQLADVITQLNLIIARLS